MHPLCQHEQGRFDFFTLLFSWMFKSCVCRDLRHLMDRPACKAFSKRNFLCCHFATSAAGALLRKCNVAMIQHQLTVT